MIVTTTNDGNTMTVTVTDAGKYFEYELTIINSEDGSVAIDYINSEREEYNLLTVDKDGGITNETPMIN